MNKLMRGWIAAGCLAAGVLVSGCSEDGDVITNINHVPDPGARDTLDLNNGTDVGFSSEGDIPLFTGPDGSILLCFQQPAGNRAIEQTIINGPAYNYARVLDDVPGPIMAMDDHGQADYDDSYEFTSQSYNLRYVAFLNQYGYWPTFMKLVVFDFQTRTFTTPALLVDSDNFGGGLFGDPNLWASNLHVDNNGRVTVLFQGHDALSGPGEDAELWTVQYDAASQTIIRSPTRISAPYSTGPSTELWVSFLDSRIAANGDIAVLFNQRQGYGAEIVYVDVLMSTVYKANTNDWSPAQRADNGLDNRFGEPIQAPSQVVLDTDGSSFQYAFLQNSEPFGYNMAVYTSRFVASQATTFPSPERLDTTTSLGTSYVDTDAFNSLDIHFGREGTSLVRWTQTDSDSPGDVLTYWACPSNETLAPAAANSASLLGATPAANAGYTIPGWEFGNIPAPLVAFDDTGRAVIAFLARNNDATPDDEVYLAMFDGGAIAPATPGSGNLAQLTPGVGETRTIELAGSSGFGAGADGHCVLVFNCSVTDFGQFVSGSTEGILVVGQIAGGTQTLATSNVRELFAMVTSGNDFGTGGRAGNSLLNRDLRTDSYMPYGTGGVWIISGRHSNAAGSSSEGYSEVQVMNYSPILPGLAPNGVTLTTLGQVDRAENWAAQADGGLDFAWGVMGLNYQRSFTRAVAGGQPAAGDAQLITPEDMKSRAYNPGHGIHIDGTCLARSHSNAGMVSTLVNQPRRWTLWLASDGKNMRLFGVRSR